MSRKIIILTLSLISTLALHAQKVTNVQFDQEGSRVIVRYTLSQRIADISLSVSTNGGKTFIRLSKVEGDVGERIEPGNHVIYWNALEEMEEIESDNVVFRVNCAKATPLRKTFLLLNNTYNIAPQWAIGLTFGQVKNYGWYFSLLTNGNFSFANDKATITNLIDYYPFYSGQSRKTYIAANAGIAVRLGEPAWLYFGAGYGRRQLAFQTMDDKWFSQVNSSHSNLSLDMGLILAIKKLNFSAGIHSIGYKYIELKSGIGFCF